jgi:Putative Flp pilus-assembly TadE/G-like
MYNLLRCRRGTAAFATVIALVPLIGVVALGGEAGSWYVTKQHAQNAADAAAMAGGWRLKCSIIAQTDVTLPCTDTNSVDYRGKQFAAQNAFCNAGDTTSYPGGRCATSLPTGTSQTVQINTLTAWNGVNGNFVQATVQQTQPAYLARVLGLSTVNIPATAVAQVPILTKPCILALSGSASFQGSVTVSSPNCGIASNSTASNAFDFTGNGGLSINAPSFAAGGCSQTGGNQCNNVTTQSAKVPDPLSAFNSAMQSLTPASFSGGSCGSTVTAYTAATPCYNAGNKTLPSTVNGTYFFNGTVNIGSVSGTATLILFGSSANIPKITGNPTIQLTGQTNPQVPPALSSVRNLMTDLVIYDPETTSNNKSVDISGTSNIVFNGTVYAPNATVTYGGNSSASTPGCFQVIAAAVQFSGNAKLDDSKCISDGAPTLEVRYVRLVP